MKCAMGAMPIVQLQIHADAPVTSKCMRRLGMALAGMITSALQCTHSSPWPVLVNAMLCKSLQHTGRARQRTGVQNGAKHTY